MSEADEPDLFRYEGASVGNNSAIVNTVIHLPGTEHFTGIKLETKQQPYGIILAYDWSESSLSHKETAVYNATYLFTLIDNVDWIQFDFDTGSDMKQYRLTREQLEEWYGVELAGINEEDGLKELLKSSFEKEKKLDELLLKSPNQQ
ncbi:DUF4825 domain-containing protein [Planococcus dechangensis]|uniref:DUF4825 domain-containing protein n=1 Tax=Planococcus dechangensis TaxID=1176255 RepID=A0ABV9MBJ6_9BACL